MCCLQERVFASPRKTRARARIFRFFSPFFCSFPFATCLPPLLATRKNVEEKGLLRRKKDATFENAERTRERVVRYHSHSFPLSHFIFLTRASFPPPHNECARETPSRRKKKKTRNPNECKKFATRDDANVLRAHAFYREMYSMHVHETMPFSKISFVDVVDVVGVSHC